MSTTFPSLMTTSTLPNTTPTTQRNSRNQQLPPFYTRELPFDYPTLINLDPTKFDDFDPLATDTMQSDTWGPLPQHFNLKQGRAAHQRDSSMSSVGSTTGPASPFNQNNSNPHIAITDYRTGDLSDMNPHDSIENHNSYYHLAKSMGSYPGYHNLDQALPEMAYPITIAGPGAKPRVDRGLLSTPDFSNSITRSHPASVASSVAGDSPATPNAGDCDIDGRRKGKRYHRISDGSIQSD